MKKDSEDAARIPIHQPQEQSQLQPSEICNQLRVRILRFVMDIEELIYKPESADSPAFLDRLASDIVSLNALGSCSGSCSKSIKEAGEIIKDVLSCPIAIRETGIKITTLEAATRYRKNKEFYDIFSTILKAYQDRREDSIILMNELKILAFDLNGEK